TEDVEDELTKSYHSLCLVSENVKEALLLLRLNSQRRQLSERLRGNPKKTRRCHNSYLLLQWCPRILPSSSVLVTGGFTVKRHEIASKPTTTVKLSVKSRQTDYFEKQKFGDSSSSPSYSSQNAEGLPARFYVGHSIYKGKAALTVEPRAPEFVFSLSVTEIGTLVSLGPRESCEFFHDPFKGKRLACICKLHQTRRRKPYEQRVT
ncbi:unnamed protein product, partial [Thlaspi arvense]